MPQNHAPLASQTELAQQLNALHTTERKARLRALLPAIDDLVRRGVSHNRLVETLTNAGFPISLIAFRKALYRWRKRSEMVPMGDSARDDRPLVSAPTGRPNPSPTSSNPQPSAIQSKADLARLRNSTDHIDLNALAELGRKK